MEDEGEGEGGGEGERKGGGEREGRGWQRKRGEAVKYGCGPFAEGKRRMQDGVGWTIDKIQDAYPFIDSDASPRFLQYFPFSFYFRRLSFPHFSFIPVTQQKLCVVTCSASRVLNGRPTLLGPIQSDNSMKW